jgi:hypothetical protein
MIVALGCAGSQVALQTPRVVGRRIQRERPVRVMAGDARDPRVSFLPALAILQTVGCKANIQGSNSGWTVGDHILPRTVAGATKID